MDQLLLSSQRLSNQKVLSTGTIDVFQLLEKQTTDSIILDAPTPSHRLELEWKEVVTPSTSTGFRDLVGKQMATYKFQYIGQFKYNGVAITTVVESFASSLKEVR